MIHGLFCQQTYTKTKAPVSMNKSSIKCILCWILINIQTPIQNAWSHSREKKRGLNCYSLIHSLQYTSCNQVLFLCIWFISESMHGSRCIINTQGVQVDQWLTVWFIIKKQTYGWGDWNLWIHQARKLLWLLWAALKYFQTYFPWTWMLFVMLTWLNQI